MFKIKCAGSKEKYSLKNENGLPCCDGEDPDAEPVRLIGSDNTLLQRLNENAGSGTPEVDPEPEEGE